MTGETVERPHGQGVLQPYSLAMAIAGKLRDRILAHRMPPGSEVSDGALAQEFGVSRTPVREALKMLCHEGLLTAHVRRGMTVTTLSRAQVREAEQLCELLKTQLRRESGSHAADVSRELTQQLLQLASSRLQLARGEPGDGSWLSEMNSGLKQP